MYVDIWCEDGLGVRSLVVGWAEKGVQELGDAGGVHAKIDFRLLILDCRMGIWETGNLGRPKGLGKGATSRMP